VDAFMCYKQKCKVVSLNLAHPVVRLVGCGLYCVFLGIKMTMKSWRCTNLFLPEGTFPCTAQLQVKCVFQGAKLS